MDSLGPDDDGRDFVKPGEKVLDQPTLSEEERKVFVEALLIGQKSEKVDVFGHQVLIKTLTVDLELQLAQVAKSWEGTVAQAKAFKTAAIAAALYEIDGVPFYIPLSATDQEEIVQRKFDKLKNYYPAFVDEIYGHLLKLEQSVSEVLEKLGKSSG